MLSCILEKIVVNKKKEIAYRKVKLPLDELKLRLEKVEPPRNFKGSVFCKKGISIIAEIKRFSPSAGVIRENLDPSTFAKIYEENGASAISVLTDKKFFGGSFDDLRKVKKASNLPILAKEFILDEYQIYEARAWGADAVLLIARILENEKLHKFCHIAQNLNLSCIVEIHSQEEVKLIQHLPPWVIIGINNRDLSKFEVDLTTTERILSYLPKGRQIISESGIRNISDMKRLKKLGITRFLMGEAILKSKSPAGKLRELLNG